MKKSSGDILLEIVKIIAMGLLVFMVIWGFIRFFG